MGEGGLSNHLHLQSCFYHGSNREIKPGQLLQSIFPLISPIYLLSYQHVPSQSVCCVCCVLCVVCVVCVVCCVCCVLCVVCVRSRGKGRRRKKKEEEEIRNNLRLESSRLKI